MIHDYSTNVKHGQCNFEAAVISSGGILYSHMTVCQYCIYNKMAEQWSRIRGERLGWCIRMERH